MTAWRYTLTTLGLLMAMAAPASMAQSAHKCTGPDGSSYFTDKPCPPDAQSKTVAGGSEKARPQLNQFIDGRCLEILETMQRMENDRRQANYRLLSDLKREYTSKCREKTAEAMQKAYDYQRNEQAQTKQAQQIEAAERARQATEQQQCAEMGRILRTKRERKASMTPGELADLQRFTDAFESRCKHP